MAKGGGNASAMGDPQLLQRVRSIIQDLDLKRPTEDSVMEHLTRKHREYLRKPQNILRRMVAKAIRAANAPPPAANTNTNTATTSKDEPTGTAGIKRSRSQSGETPQKQTQQSSSGAVAEGDTIPTTPKTHDSLNSTLRSKYRTKQTPNAPTTDNSPETNNADSSATNTPAVKRIMRKRSTGGGSSSGGGGIPGLSKRTISPSERPTVRFSDVGGVESIIQDVRELCEYPLRHPELYAHLGVEPPRGILLHGPPGCGKTLLANAIAGELEVPFFKVAATEMVSGMSGESEEKVRSLFEEAKAAAPSIIFIDEIDAITSKRESTSRGMEKRIVAQLLTSMDSLAFNNWSGSATTTDDGEGDENGEAKVHKAVIVIGATNYPDALDPALRRAGRFDREIAMGIPDQKARERILLTLTGKMKLEGSFDLIKIARLTPGYVGADLSALAKEAAVIAINRIFGGPGKQDQASIQDEPSKQDEDSDDGYDAAFSDALAPERMESSGDVIDADFIDVEMGGSQDTPMTDVDGGSADVVNHEGGNRKSAAEALGSRDQLTVDQMAPLCITMADFEEATTKVQPSSKREGFATVPAVSWDDIGAMDEVRDELNMAIMEPIKNPETFAAMGLTVPAGVLLYGPPGCGKTLVAKAVANGSGANFISIKGPELLNKYVGESERAVRQVFARARSSSPCIIFFDELDALCPRRGQSETGVNERVVNQLLTEMDGLDGRQSVFVVAATNRPDIIDPAMLRPGRLDRLVYVPLPEPQDRYAILATCARKTPLASCVDLKQIGMDERMTGFSGADLAATIREATMMALKRRGFSSVAGGDDDDKEKANKEPLKVMQTDLLKALDRVTPSVSKKDKRLYDAMRKRLKGARANLDEENKTAQAASAEGGGAMVAK